MICFDLYATDCLLHSSPFFRMFPSLRRFYLDRAFLTALFRAITAVCIIPIPSATSYCKCSAKLVYSSWVRRMWWRVVRLRSRRLLTMIGRGYNSSLILPPFPLFSAWKSFSLSASSVGLFVTKFTHHVGISLCIFLVLRFYFISMQHFWLY